MSRHALRTGSPGAALLAHWLAHWTRGETVLQLGLTDEILPNLLVAKGLQVTVASRIHPDARRVVPNAELLDIDPCILRLDCDFDAVVVDPVTLSHPGTVRSRIAVLATAAEQLASGGIVLSRTLADARVRYPTPQELDLMANTVGLRLLHRASDAHEDVNVLPVVSIYDLMS